MSAFREIVRFEIALHVRGRLIWIYAAVFMGLAFVTMTSFSAGARGSLFNAPLAVAGATVVAGICGLLVTAALAGEAATRDAKTRMEPLLHTVPITRRAYLGGRFVGTFVINALVLTAVPLGLIVAALVQPDGPDVVGPFRPDAYLSAYVLLALPTAFTTTALLFSAATITRTSVAGYVGALVLFLSVMLVEGVVAEAMGRWSVATLLDPFGIVMILSLVRSWTDVQKDTLLVGLEGVFLWNRLLWLAIAASALWLAHFESDASTRGAGRTRWRRLPGTVTAETASMKSSPGSTPIVAPCVPRTFGAATHIRQTLDIAWRSFRTIVSSRGAVVLAFPAVFLALFGPQLMVNSGTPLLPTTAHIIGLLVDSGDIFLAIAAPFLIVVYAGELVWQERDAGLSDVADATPVPDWVPFLGKLLGLSLVLIVLQALMMAGGILLQLFLGYDDLELALYLRALFVLQLPEHLLFAVLALAVHTVVNQKYVAHLVVLLAYAFTIFAPGIGIEHHMLIYASDPGWTYSDIRGFDPFLAPVAWFTLYWTAWALWLAVAAVLLWVRGRERGARSRLRLARRRVTNGVVGLAAAASALVLTAGGVILYNTNVLNAHTTAADRMERRAEYERRYSQYARTRQAELTGVLLDVEVHPAERRVDLRGTFTLVNTTASPIESVHVATVTEVEVREVRFDRQARPVSMDEDFGHRIYALEPALKPGESLLLTFDVRAEPRGFLNGPADASIVGNGTYIPHQWLPAIGYQASRELQRPGDRRAHGLPARPEIPPLDDADARQDRSGAERIAFEAIVSTDEGQIAVAPGTLRRRWVENGRQYFHYVTDAPIRNDYAFFSAAYAVRKGQHGAVAIEVLHHPGHALNAGRMVSAVQASFDYLTRHFGPYPHAQIRLVEHPGDGNGLHAAPVNISYEEGFSLFNPDDAPDALDFPFAIVAHEVAHQWWGNQLTPAFVEGGALLTESLAWYSALGVVEDALGPEQLRRLLDVMRRAYLTPRARAGVSLLRAHDWFLAYRKGAFAMYALREYVGEGQVNTALRRLLESHGAGTPPLPTSRDLYRELQAVTPPVLQPLLADLLAANTFWELSAEGAAAKPDGTGNWQVTLDVQARKVVVDEEGLEHDVPMDDLIEVGVYAAGQDGRPGAPLYQRMHRISSGAQRILVTVPAEPSSAGIDPRHLLIDVVPDDNRIPVRAPASPTDQGK